MQSNVFVGIKPGPKYQGGLHLLEEFGAGHQDGHHNHSHNRQQDVGTDKGAFLITSNCDYILLPLTNSRYRGVVNQVVADYERGNSRYTGNLRIPAPKLQDICISPFQRNVTAYIGLLSSWIELDSEDPIKRDMSLQVLIHECKYAEFVGITTLILAPPRNIANIHRYAQMVSRVLNHNVIKEGKITLSISLPLCEANEPLATWDLWSTIRKLCGSHIALSVSLALTRTKAPRYVLERWYCEPVSCLLVSSSIFASNQYGYPVLHKFNQNIIMKFQAINGNSQLENSRLCIVLHGIERYADEVKGGEESYLEYINYLLKKGDKLMLTTGRATYLNSPQIMTPLKPHSEDLSDEIYSIFEEDDAKYELYGSSIKAAVRDILSTHKFAHKNDKIVILVAGAGRGPLVDITYKVACDLRATDKIELIALEKNDRAYLYLQKRNFEYWNNYVKLINEDMTKLNLSTEANKNTIDLCISEMLGSFGCNELSPECLWHIEKNYCTPSTIFIPQSYSSFVAPCSLPLLYQKLSIEMKRTRRDKNLLESPWIIQSIPYAILSSTINEVWSFSHPIKNPSLSPDIVFSRNELTEFQIKHRGVIHGIVSFFVARLYSDITLSILPSDFTLKTNGNGPLSKQGVLSLGHTKNMYSWSPLVFPLEEPLSVADNTEVSVMISRMHCNDRVWYEWSAESYIYLAITDVSIRSDKSRKKSYQEQPSNNVTLGTSGAFSAMDPNIVDNGMDPSSRRQHFESVINEEGLNQRDENEWQSVNDIHGLDEKYLGSGNRIKLGAKEPLFNLRPQNISGQENGEEEEDSEEDEVHVRVKTGVSKLHNVSGSNFYIPIK